MNKKSYNLLSDVELASTLIGCIVATGLFSLVASVVDSAKQDGWILIIMGASYPLIIIGLSSIIIKYYPDRTIMDLCSILLGKFVGNFLNFLFMAQWLLYAIVVIATAINMLIVYSVWFMTPLKIFLVYICLIVWGSTKGLKLIAQMNVIGFGFLAILLSTSIIAFSKGSVLNLQPVFDTNIKLLFQASTTSFFAYGNMELLLVIHPFIRNKQNIVKVALISTGIVLFIFLWVVITALFYLGPDIVPKAFWPFFYISEAIKMPIINNFRFILMIFWPLIIYRTVTTEFYAATAVMSHITGMNRKNWCVLLSVFLFLALYFENEVQVRKFSDQIFPAVTVFNVIYVAIIGIISWAKNQSA